MYHSKQPYLKPALRKIEPEYGNSFVLRNFTEKLTNQVPRWHYHPELELVYIEEGSGKRHIGNHLSCFSDGDLIMIGSNLPHMGFASRLNGENQEVVLQVDENCFGQGFLEMNETASIKKLFETSKLGLSFYGDTKREVGQRLKSMFQMAPFEKMIELIRIFHLLSQSREFEILDANGLSIVISGSDNHRIDTIYSYVRRHFTEPIALVDVAALVNMTEPSFCRFFKKATNKTFFQFLVEYRIMHASKLLSEKGDKTISMIADECGFQNISNFNRAFKKITGKSPSEYRNDLRRVLGGVAG